MYSRFETVHRLFLLIPPLPSDLSMSTASNDVLSWTNQDPRESQLFNSWGVLYRFQVCISQARRFSTGFVLTDGGEHKRTECYDALARDSSKQGRSRRKARVVCHWRPWTRRDRQGISTCTRR